MSVKFCWFNPMPWPELPDDFREKNRSVWVDIPSELYDPERGNHVYPEQPGAVGRAILDFCGH